MKKQTTMLGINGTLDTYRLPSGLFRTQAFISEIRRKQAREYEMNTCQVEVCFDDKCRNGHQTFSITAQLRDSRQKRPRGEEWDMFGCCHEELVEFFPELKPYLKWHLTSTDGPMHYVANTLYHLSDRDFRGKLKGEPYSFEKFLKVNDSPILVAIPRELKMYLDLESGFARFKKYIHHPVTPVAVPYYDKNAAHPYSPQYRLSCMPECRWGHAPFDTHAVAEQWIDALTNHQCEVVEVPTAWGEGKTPNLDAARKSAVWPDATDEELSLPREEMKAVLEARGMPLQTDFKQAMHELGLQWEEEKKE